MTRRKNLQKKEKGDAWESKLDENGLLEVFNQFREEIRKEIDGFKVVIDELKNEVQDKEKKIEVLQKENGKLFEKLRTKEKEMEKQVMVVDKLERKVCDVEGGFILSGKDLREIFDDENEDEFDHFTEHFQRAFCNADDRIKGLWSKEDNKGFSVISLKGSANGFKIKIKAPIYDSNEIESFITDDFRRQLNGRFEWIGKNGQKRKVSLKKNKTFIERKMGTLMYNIFKRIEEETKNEIEKVWRNGKLFVNGEAVRIERSYSSLIAYMNERKIAEMNW